MKAFNRYIASRLDTLEWRHFGVGALQAYLLEGEEYEQRLHIWHPSLITEGIIGAGDMHNHRFSFTSKVLCGHILHQEYHVEDYELGNCDAYEVVNAREQKDKTGSYNGSVKFDKHVDVCEKGARQHNGPGDEYEFQCGKYHVTSFVGTTVTLLTKFDITPGIRARIIVPRGKTLVQAFDDSQKPDISRIIRFAKETLTKET